MDIRKLVADQIGALMMTNLELLAQNKVLEDRIKELEAQLAAKAQEVKE